MILKILCISTLAFAGVACLLLRQGMIRLLVGIHLLSMSSALVFIVFGESIEGGANQGEPFALLVLLGGTIVFSLGLALATRLFYQKGRAELDDLRELKN